MEKFIVKSAGITDLEYMQDVVDAIFEASQHKGTGIAIRTPEYIKGKILQGKAIIALTEQGEWAGFCYIESWGHNKFVANSGLVVSGKYRGHGLAHAIKEKAMNLSLKLFQGAKLFGLTTSLAVMKINSDLCYRPVTFSELTDDEQFWKCCESCPYYDILVRTRRSHCLCTGMLMDTVKQNKEDDADKLKSEKITILA